MLMWKRPQLERSLQGNYLEGPTVFQMTGTLGWGLVENEKEAGRQGGQTPIAAMHLQM